MKVFPTASLCLALAIPLMSAACTAPDEHAASSDAAIVAGGEDHGGGWCPMSALATCQAHCEQVSACALAPFFPQVDVGSCALACAEALVTDKGQAREVVACLSAIEQEHACCDVMGCAAGWLEPKPAHEVPEPQPESDPTEDSPEVADSHKMHDQEHHASQARCSQGAAFSTNGLGRAFCLFEGMALPEGADVKAYCHWLHLGYMGFHFPDTQTPEGYQCPEPSQEGTNEVGLTFCTVSGLTLPDSPTLEPTCEHLEDEVFGYTWCLDPAAEECDRAPSTEVGDAGASSDDEDDIDEEEPPFDPGDHDESTSSPGNDGGGTDADDGEETPTEETDGAPTIKEGEAELPLPETDGPQEPAADQEDLRCRDMCTRLDHCGGLDTTTLDVHSCTSLCRSWGGWFQEQIFDCCLSEETTTCDEVLTCYAPGPGN